MPRTARILPDQGVMHIITRGNNRQVVFRNEVDFKHYLYLLSLYKEEHRFELYHYCLMSNHVHLIIETTLQTNLPKLMKQINLSYMHFFRKKYRYYGHFWQDRYKSLLIEKDNYLLACGKYVELNPVRAGIVVSPEEYPWSSYAAYTGEKDDPIVSFDLLYTGLGKTQKDRADRYKELVCENIKHGSRYIGSEAFVSAMEMRFGIQNDVRSIGRPKGGS
ncbi:MAG: transposase [Elusimicrobiota bacterium]